MGFTSGWTASKFQPDIAAEAFGFDGSINYRDIKILPALAKATVLFSGSGGQYLPRKSHFVAGGQ